MIENDEQDKDNLFIIEFSQNLNDTYGKSKSDNNSDQKIQNEENIEGRGGRGSRNRVNRGQGQGCGQDRGQNQGQNYEITEQNVQLLHPPPFNILKHSKPLHEFAVTLPKEYQSNLLSPYLIFYYFFTLEQINIIVQNTNKYAYLKDAGK